MLSVYTAGGHVGVGVTAALILNLGYESGCSGSNPSCSTTFHLPIAPPSPLITLGALCSWQVRSPKRSALGPVSISRPYES